MLVLMQVACLTCHLTCWFVELLLTMVLPSLPPLPLFLRASAHRSAAAVGRTIGKVRLPGFKANHSMWSPLPLLQQSEVCGKHASRWRCMATA